MKIIIASALWASFFCLALAADVSAQSKAVHWAAQGGSGTACTKAKPCAAWYAAKSAVAGETWYFKPGTYRLASPLAVGHSGKRDAPIIFSAAPGAKRRVVFDGAGWSAVKKSHIHVKGFKIQNVPGDGIRFECRAGTRCAGIRIEGNWTRRTRFSGIAVHGALFQFGQYATDNVVGLVIKGNRVERANTGGVTENISVSNGINGAEIAHNEVLDGFNLGIDVKAGARNVKIHHNTIRGHRGTAIYIDSSRRYVENVQIYNNRIVGGSGISGIRLAREVWSKAKAVPDGPRLERIKIYNNVISGVPGAAIALQRIRVDDVRRGTYRNILVSNNTVVRSKHAVVVADHPRMLNIVVRNNLARTRGSSYRFDRPVASSHNISSDGSEGTVKAVPSFVDMKGRNYRLLAGSPGVDHGAGRGAAAFDFDGAARLQGKGIDIGAFER